MLPKSAAVTTEQRQRGKQPFSHKSLCSLFESFAYETLAKQQVLKYFLAVRYETCESKVVSEEALKKLISEKQVDEAAIVSVKWPEFKQK